MEREENPFEDEQVAKEWIESVEGEKGLSRDTVIYPLIEEWASNLDPKAIIVEIGSGQGICADKLKSKARYIGVEPSAFLVDRAKEKYPLDGREFKIGNAYDLPIENESADAVFSVNVWFHLEDLSKATSEINRILKHGGLFLIITTNPNAYDIWENFYESPVREGNKIIGKVNVPVKPMTRNSFYEHTEKEMVEPFEKENLKIDSIGPIGEGYKETGRELFIAIRGHKI